MPSLLRSVRNRREERNMEEEVGWIKDREEKSHLQEVKRGGAPHSGAPFVVPAILSSSPCF